MSAGISKSTARLSIPARIRRLAAAAGVALAPACGTTLTDLTPPVQQSDDSRFSLSVDAQPQPMAIPATIDARVVIDGTPHPMSGSGPGTWSYVHEARCAESLTYHFEVSNAFNPPPFPIYVNTTSTRLPANGTASIQIDPVYARAPQFSPMDGLEITCSAGSDACTRPITISNSGGCVLTIALPQVLPSSCGVSCPVGQNDGSGFNVVNEGEFPVTLDPDDSFQVLIRAFRASSYTVYNARLEIAYQGEYVAPGSRTLTLSSQVFFFP